MKDSFPPPNFYRHKIHQKSKTWSKVHFLRIQKQIKSLIIFNLCYTFNVYFDNNNSKQFIVNLFINLYVYLCLYVMCLFVPNLMHTTLRVQHSTPVMHEKVHYNKTEIFKIGNIHLKHIRGRNDILQSVQLVQTCWDWCWLRSFRNSDRPLSFSPTNNICDWYSVQTSNKQNKPCCKSSLACSGQPCSKTPVIDSCRRYKQ